MDRVWNTLGIVWNTLGILLDIFLTALVGYLLLKTRYPEIQFVESFFK